ncbi:hypothetical protein L1987_85823 [Smallanthus sonchifolius]|uniref:Uncharacterized protein n=1 Tax=Smallanthus sonchifolius TaxID=185202 RepID=A0ACB8XYE3_9ASTR|nr:hypothetical protein L1987_85823 [Smallanthus sonchifolius]
MMVLLVVTDASNRRCYCLKPILGFASLKLSAGDILYDLLFVSIHSGAFNTFVESKFPNLNLLPEELSETLKESLGDFYMENLTRSGQHVDGENSKPGCLMKTEVEYRACNLLKGLPSRFPIIKENFIWCRFTVLN